MKKNPSSKGKTAPRIDPYLEGLMGKLLDRLTGLEKKMDLVIAQTASKSGGAEQTQPAPRRDRTLYEAICADCHKICEVPFRPSEARPVYCKECFAKRKSGSSSHGMPVLTPVVLLPKPVSKLGAATLPPQTPRPAPKKAAKKKLLKKTKRSK